MLCLSIRQPWAWLILYAGKNIENRDWHTSVRERILIHAGKGMTKVEYEESKSVAIDVHGWEVYFPEIQELERGGIVGSVEITDCVSHSESPWFFGKYGFVLSKPKMLSFKPFKGQLGFFEVPESVWRDK